MISAQVSGASVAELGGLLAATFLVAFQFFGTAESTNVSNLNLFTSLEFWNT